MRDFSSLSEKEILALAISLEEDDERIYADLAEGLRADFPASAAVFNGMREEESGHRRRLLELFRSKFGEHIPLIRRQHVKGFVQREPVWLHQPLNIQKIRNQASAMEAETRRFYEQAAASCSTILPRWSAHTSLEPKNWNSKSWDRGQRRKKQKQSAGFLSCRSSSRGLPA
jgi:rubrerythrin